jgi:putative nucleotidyltransferase with HDIG domain
VLKWANSAWSQSQTSIDNVPAAVVRLGCANVLKLTIGYHLMGPMNKAQPGYNMPEHELWRHSVAAALAVEAMDRKKIKRVPPAAFTTALIHDLGKIVLGRRLGHESLLDMIESLVAEKQCTYSQAEKEAMGTDHAEVGALIAAEWHLPQTIIDAIAFHHDVSRHQDGLLDIVHLADVVAKSVQQNKAIEDMMELELDLGSLQRLSITGTDLTDLVVMVQSDLRRTEKQWQAL